VCRVPQGVSTKNNGQVMRVNKYDFAPYQMQKDHIIGIKILSENNNEIGRINLKFRTRDLGEDTLDRQSETENEIRLK